MGRDLETTPALHIQMGLTPNGKLALISTGNDSVHDLLHADVYQGLVKCVAKDPDGQIEGSGRYWWDLCRVVLSEAI